MHPGMTTRGYRLSPLAEVDLEEIWFYTLEHWSLDQADSYHHDLVAAFEALASGEKRGRTVDIRPGYFKHPAGAHMIYFRDHGDWVEVIRILHNKRDVERHL
jgi:toxin ParE1/3/4